MAQSQATVIQAERTRKLPPVPFVENQARTLDLPRDTVLKRLNIRLAGSVQTTYASGTPVADAQSTFARICPRLDVVINGSRTVKSVNPFFAQQQQLMLQGTLGERRYTVSASAPTSNLATSEGGFNFGSTTQYTIVNESVTIYFEDMWAYGFGREMTHLNLKGVASAALVFNFAAQAAIQAANDTTAITWANNGFTFSVTTVEAADVPADVQFYDLKETIKTVQYTAESRDSVVEINRGNFLQGIMFVVRNGDAPMTMSNIALRDIKLVLNGNALIKTTTFLDLQAENRGRYGINAPYAANASRLDGSCYMQLLKGGDIRSALDLRREAGVDAVQLLLTTAPSTGLDAATYTPNPVQVGILTQEVVMSVA